MSTTTKNPTASGAKKRATRKQKSQRVMDQKMQELEELEYTTTSDLTSAANSFRFAPVKRIIRAALHQQNHGELRVLLFV